MTAVPVALVGPTASGKTAMSIALARATGAEIVCVDSMTVYRGMDVGTAKPGTREREAIPHHMIDIRDPGEAFSVAEYQREAVEAVTDIEGRGARAMYVGGAGLYWRALVDGLRFPPMDPSVRARIEREPAEQALARLRATDPEAAGRIEPGNRRRIVRALEVIELTGRPFSSFAQAWGRYEGGVAAAGLELDSRALAERIAARTRAMIEGGLLDEVSRLLDRGFRDALTSSQAIAYREAVAVLDGRLQPDELAAAIDAATKRFARRQMSWFRKDPRIRWFDASDLERATAQIAAYYDDFGVREARSWNL